MVLQLTLVATQIIVPEPPAVGAQRLSVAQRPPVANRLADVRLRIADLSRLPIAAEYTKAFALAQELVIVEDGRVPWPLDRGKHPSVDGQAQHHVR